MDRNHPFFCGSYNEMLFFHQTVDDRLRVVREATREGLEEILKTSELQSTVRKAAMARLCRLEKEENKNA